MKFNIIKACGINTIAIVFFNLIERGLDIGLSGTQSLIFGSILFIGSLCATYE